ncbi:hydroxyacid dehydrogenase [Candidatus Micrarchaeota archaeon]|nr:hydroxyacid dehydrogenase [Candidatus Micrarchaeota archaeon]
MECVIGLTMAKPHIAFFELEPWEKGYFQKALTGFNLQFIDGPLKPQDISKVKDADAIAAFVFSKFDAATLKKLSKLKLLCTMSTGFDHVDLKTAKKQGVTVCNVPEYGSNTVAEHTFALLLSISRKVPQSLSRIRLSDFSREGLRGFDLAGKTMGIIGMGKIGRHVARIARGFEMNVLACDPFLTQKEAEILCVGCVPLKKLLSESDVITLHAPLTDKTRHLINTRNLKHVKKGAVLVNTSRGALVETRALLEGLKNGTFSALGLDVLEDEGVIQEEKALLHRAFADKVNLRRVLEEHVLLDLENVVVTPHNAFNSQEALERILDTTADNIKAYFKKKPRNTV